MNRTGLRSQQVEESRKKHGDNSLTQIPPDPLWKKILEGLQLKNYRKDAALLSSLYSI